LQFLDEVLYSTSDLVTDRPDNLDALTGRVIHHPVLIAFARIERTRVAAPHGDDEVGGFDGLGGQDFGCSAVMSTPSSVMACTATGFIRSAGSEPAERTSIVSPAAGVMAQHDHSRR
jgi:hypothetical protein